MFYYRIDSIKNNGRRDILYIKGVRELNRAEFLWFLNSIYSDGDYIDFVATLVDEDMEEQVDFIKNVVLGGNFYNIHYRTAMGPSLHLCITGTAFPSEYMVMKYNKYLSKYKQIEEIYSIEKVSAAKISDELRKRKKYYENKKIETKTDPNFDLKSEKLWVFTDVWFMPFELL